MICRVFSLKPEEDIGPLMLNKGAADSQANDTRIPRARSEFFASGAPSPLMAVRNSVACVRA